MDYRRLGKTDLRVSAISLGCGRFGSVGQKGGDEAALRLVGQALEAGINFFDTSDIYGQGASEILLGKALRERRDKAIIVSKAGFCLSSLGSAAGRFKPLLRKLLRFRPGFARSIQKVRAAQNRQAFSAAYLTKCVEGSLARLGVEALDVFLLHSPPTEVLERGEVFDTIETLRKQGKIRHGGVSCRNASDVLLCVGQPGIAVLQVELSLLTPDSIEQALPLARVADVGIMARRIFAGGLLLRSAAQLQPADGAERGEDFGELKSRHERLERFAAANGLTLAQMALQSLLQMCDISSVLIGTTSGEHLREHLSVLKRPLLLEQVKSISLAARTASSSHR
jgi:aryl-alcohol dehydrogenase-like predicted oxidoreductase